LLESEGLFSGAKRLSRALEAGTIAGPALGPSPWGAVASLKGKSGDRYQSEYVTKPCSLHLISHQSLIHLFIQLFSHIYFNTNSMLGSILTLGSKGEHDLPFQSYSLLEELTIDRKTK
jgi:hypothetical protein